MWKEGKRECCISNVSVSPLREAKTELKQRNQNVERQKEELQQKTKTLKVRK